MSHGVIGVDFDCVDMPEDTTVFDRDQIIKDLYQSELSKISTIVPYLPGGDSN
jgi:hypothetical protein